MSKKRWEQMGAAGGIAFVVLQILSQALIQIGGTEPSFNASPQEIVDFFINRNPQLFAVGSLLSALSVIAFLWFLGVLWTALRVHEGEPGWLSLVAFGSGLVGLATVLPAGSGWTLAVFRMGEGLEPQMARFLFDQVTLALPPSGSSWPAFCWLPAWFLFETERYHFGWVGLA